MADTLNELRQSLQGSILEPGDARYDLRRAIFNGMIDRHPTVIVQPINQADVLRTLAYARSHALDLAIRGGGHNVAGLAICDGGVVIDFESMRAVHVSPSTRSAVVQPGATWGELDAATHSFGLATTGGIISETGVAGLTLGGGLGWLMGVHGLTCDNLRRAVVVLANGEVVVAAENQHPDLFWALRGGGGNFGVVVEFEFELHPVVSVYAGAVVYPLSRAQEALSRFVTVGDNADDALTLSVIMTTSTSGEKVVELDACFLGDERDGQAATEGLVGVPSSELVDTRRQQPYVEWQTAFDDPFRRGRRSYWKGLYVTRLDLELFGLLTDAVANAPSPDTMLTFDHVHGAAARAPAESTAFRHRDKRYLLLINTNWNDAADDDLNISWTRDLFAELEPFGVPSGYVNYLSEEGDDRVLSVYGDETYARLSSIKGRYDPTNVFHCNQNIRPNLGPDHPIDSARLGRA